METAEAFCDTATKLASRMRERRWLVTSTGAEQSRSAERAERESLGEAQDGPEGQEARTKWY